MKILFDADSMVYGCAFAAQTTQYDYIATDGVEIVEGIAKSKEDLDATAAMLPDGWKIESVDALVEPDPVENALALVKRQILRIEKKLDSDGYQFDKLDVYITGKGNHRDTIAKVKPYKGNRVNTAKPVHYAAVRRYMMTRWNAIKVDGWEADDAVAAAAAALDYDPAYVMIVSQDKDLRTVPGLLFNYRRGTYELITERQAHVNFYRQMLAGDVTDNICGATLCGEVKAEKLITEDMTEAQMWATACAEFKASLSRRGCLYTDRDPVSVAIEMGQLLHMSRVYGDVWMPPA
jgi:uncharacterized protein YijF (DUF1287 family)